MLDFAEHTSEEERMAVKAFPYKRLAAATKKPSKRLAETALSAPIGAEARKRPAETASVAVSSSAVADEDDDLMALLAQVDNAMQPIHTLDSFTYWVQRVVAETVFREALATPEACADTPDMRMYHKAVSGSRDTVLAKDVLSTPLASGVELLKEAAILVTTASGVAHFYPQHTAYAAVSGDELAVLEFLHVALHLRSYLVASIVHCCSPTGVEEDYLTKSYPQLWDWLVGTSRVGLPVSSWSETGGAKPFVDHVCALWRLHCTALEVAASLTL